MELELLDRLPDALLVGGADGRLRWCNRRATELLGWAAAELNGMRLEALITEQSQQDPPVEWSALARGERVVVDRPLRRRDAPPILAEVSAVQLSDGRVVATVRGIGDRVRMLADLRHALSLAEATIEATTDAVLVHDLQGRILAWNQNFCRVWRLSEEALRSCATRQQAFELVRHLYPDPDGHRRRVDELERSDREWEVLVLRLKDGRVMERWSNPQRVQGEVVGRVVGYRDVTERERTLEELQRVVALHRAMLESTTDGFAVSDLEGRIVAHNQQLARLWRCPSDAIERGSARELFDRACSELRNREAYEAMIREAADDPERPRYLVLEFLDGRVMERWSYPLFVSGQCSGHMAVYRDLTESRRQAEDLRRSQQQFLQAQKMEAVGRLAGGIAHDFNNMLTAILGHGDLLARSMAPDDPRLAAVDEIRLAAERSARLTRELLTFSRRQPSREQVVNVEMLVERARPLLHTLLGTHVELVVEARSRDPWVLADMNSVEQALLNLAINARDAMQGRGRLVIAIGEEDLRALDIELRGARRAGRHVTLAVTDTGPGIPPDVRPHLFEPFFTTKEPGQGTGLGLASVYGIVEQCGGFIEVESEPGHGATFRVLLPRTDQRPGGTRAPSVAEPQGGTPSPRVLVVEDEGAVRLLVETLLRREGYEVITAKSGIEALALLDGPAADVDLLLSDLMMPGLAGDELAARVVASRPDVRVLLMSGFPGDRLAQDRAEPEWPVLRKPFTREHLVSAIRDACARDERG
jgi:PAS domain S-box-containing protein